MALDVLPVGPKVGTVHQGFQATEYIQALDPAVTKCFTRQRRKKLFRLGWFPESIRNELPNSSLHAAKKTIPN